MFSTGFDERQKTVAKECQTKFQLLKYYVKCVCFSSIIFKKFRRYKIYVGETYYDNLR